MFVEVGLTLAFPCPPICAHVKPLVDKAMSESEAVDFVGADGDLTNSLRNTDSIFIDWYCRVPNSRPTLKPWRRVTRATSDGSAV